MTMIGDLEEKMPDKEIGPVGRVMGDGESGVLAEASQLFPDFRTCQTPSLLEHCTTCLRWNLISSRSCSSGA